MEFLDTLSNLALVIAGFTFIIFIHELGHFVAAKWAGIRVLAFAIGFGPAAASYRKGLGFRRGSSENEYLQLKERDAVAAASVSPTEYRWNWLPFGGYVKMLGQEDINPNAISSEADSYQSCVPWKRMVVISAGVIANIILASLLFMLVFMVGIKMPSPKVGGVLPGSSTATTMAENASELGVTTPGLQRSDLILTINGREMTSYSDILPEVALSNKSELLDVQVKRANLSQPLHFRIKPTVARSNGVLDLAVAPSMTNTLYMLTKQDALEGFQRRMNAIGLNDVRPGMTLVAANGQPINSAGDLDAAVDASNGNPLSLTFKDDKGEVTGSMKPHAKLQVSMVQISGPDDEAVVGHLIGIMPVMRVGSTTKDGYAKGLRAGDVFVRLGDADYPSILDGVRQIRSHKGKLIDVVVNRREGDSWKLASFKAQVDSDGRIGFDLSDTRDLDNIAALPLKSVKLTKDSSDYVTPAVSGLISSPGTRILKINGKPTATFREMRAELLAIKPDTGGDATLKLTLLPPATATGQAAHEVEGTCKLTPSELEALRNEAFGWENPFPDELFKTEEVLIKADGPIAAIKKGVSETRRWMLSVYVTFLRLYQGSVPVNQLHGPIGIATVGTSIASMGFIHLLLFMAMISVNLAVVNFLPLPIVDGGQFLFLLWEQIRGKPASLQVQNAATLAGIVIIGAMFLFVTFNDIAAFFHR